MIDIEHALNSANKCTQNMVDEESGAGAIAGSKADTIFITTTPLSELVWSQRQGLSLKYATSGLSEKKASLLWNTESFNIMISSPQPTNVGESSSTRDFNAGTLNSLQQKQNSENYDSKRVSLVGSPRSILGVQHEENRGCFGDQELLNRKGKEVLDNKPEHGQSDKKEAGIYLHRNDNSLCNMLRPEADTSDMNHDQTSMPGPDNYGPSAESLLCKLKELGHDLPVEAPYASYTGASPDTSKGLGRKKNYQTSSMEEVSANEDYMLAKYESPIKSASNSKSAAFRQADVASHTVECNNTLCRQFSDDVLSSDFRGRSEVGITVISQPADRGKDGPWQASNKDNCSPIWYQADCNLKSPNMRKGKEHVSSDVEDRVSISKEREDSHESVESSNSRRLISTGKRALSADPKIPVVSKKLKRQRNETSCSGSLYRHGNSFKNWISTITSGYTRSEQATPLAFIPHPSFNAETNLSTLPKSNEKNDLEISRKNTGFKSIFQALYRPSYKVHDSTGKDLDLQREAITSKKHKISEQLHGSCHMACGNVELNLCNVIPKTNERINSGSKDHISSGQLVCDGDSDNLLNQNSTSCDRHNHGTYHVKELDRTQINISSNFRFHKKLKCNVGQTCNLNIMESPSCGAIIVPGHTSENKGTVVPAAVPNSSSNMATNRSGFLESFWIRRFSPKVSSPTENTSNCKQGMELVGERVTKNCNMLDSNAVSSNRERSNSGNCHLLEWQTGSVKDEIQEQSIFSIEPCGSKRINNRKLKSNLNPILPSQRFKKSEQMASDFAKRLDAIRDIEPSIISNNAGCSTTFCFFCGKCGHSIMKCSELDEKELKKLLKNMNSYDVNDESSCLCIRCFQLDHWAISCPHVSSQIKLSADNAFIFDNGNCNRVKNKPGNPCSYYDGRITLWSGGKQERHQVIGECENPRRGNARVETELTVKSDADSGMDKVVAPYASNLCINPVKEAIRETALKMNPTSSSSGENESKENQIPYSNFVAIEVTDESVGIFETIRRLRLSRTDIIRWMKSPFSQFSLEGFFLRLRLGKLEEGLGGTGYHVACLNGVLEHNLSVFIGGFTYLVDCRYISNHDFVEDELKAWWSATLKSGAKPPSVDELNKKLQERVKLGF